MCTLIVENEKNKILKIVKIFFASNECILLYVGYPYFTKQPSVHGVLLWSTFSSKYSLYGVADKSSMDSTASV